MFTLDIVYNIGYVVGVLSLTFLLHYLMGRGFHLIYEKVCKRTRTHFDDELIPLLRRLCGISLWVSAGYALALYFAIDIKIITASFGVGSIAISMLVKDSIANIFAGIVIMFDKPFVTGDVIKLPTGEKGEVVKIGVRRTDIKLEDGSHLIIMNSALSKLKIYNYTYKVRR